MSPQFVDFDADGKLDIVAGTYDGSPHLARGDGKGWHQPKHILDASGARIALHAFWNDETKKWDETTRGDVAGEPPATGRCTSAVALDWDGDGDFDLLLGDHRTGHIYRRDNGGTASKPAFAAGNRLVHAGGKPIDVPGTVATIRVCDWNRDGLTDLLVGSMGDAFGADEGGGVYLFLNDGSKQAPRLQAPLVLVPPSKKGAIDAATRPDSGIYPDVGDIDGDGDLDLLVGGYSHWTPRAPELTAAQQARVTELRAGMHKLDTEMRALDSAAEKAGEGLPAAEAEKKWSEAYAGQQTARDALMKQRMPLAEEVDKLVPRAQRSSCVWLYENTGGAGAGSGAK